MKAYSHYISRAEQFPFFNNNCLLKYTSNLLIAFQLAVPTDYSVFQKTAFSVTHVHAVTEYIGEIPHRWFECLRSINVFKDSQIWALKKSKYSLFILSHPITLLWMN